MKTKGILFFILQRSTPKPKPAVRRNKRKFHFVFTPTHEVTPQLKNLRKELFKGGISNTELNKVCSFDRLSLFCYCIYIFICFNIGKCMGQISPSLKYKNQFMLTILFVIGRLRRWDF